MDEDEEYPEYDEWDEGDRQYAMKKDDDAFVYFERKAELEHDLAEAEARFRARGGRGVELADEIDALRLRLENLK